MIELERIYMEEAGDDGAAGAGGGEAPAAEAPAAEADSGSIITDQTDSTGGESGQSKGESESSLITDTQEGDNKEESDGENSDEAKEESRAPEQYDEFAAPEGFNLQAEALDSFHDWARGNDFTQEQAQAAIDYHADAMKAYQQLQADQWAEARQEWVDAAKSDKEYGGKQFEQNMKHVGAALSHFGDKDLVDMLNTSGFGDHPAMVRFFWKVGQKVGEADLIGGKTEGGQADALSRFYPSMAKK